MKRITTPVSMQSRLENAALDVMTARDPETRKAALARFRMLEEMAAREELAAHRAKMAVTVDHSGDAHR